MLVKICGIQTLEAGIVAAEAGADFIGFVFAPSKRRVTPEQAAIIIKSLPHTVRTVGVFVNKTAEQINSIATYAGLDIIQLHGDEPNDLVNQINHPVIRAFQADKIQRITRNATSRYEFCLVDSPGEKYRGGSGKTFDWTLTENIIINKNRLMLAGGLTPDNVQDAIKQVQPAAVDTSSGVETNQQKDHNKIRYFINNAKNIEKGCKQ